MATPGSTDHTSYGEREVGRNIIQQKTISNKFTFTFKSIHSYNSTEVKICENFDDSKNRDIENIDIDGNAVIVYCLVHVNPILTDYYQCRYFSVSIQSCSSPPSNTPGV